MTRNQQIQNTAKSYTDCKNIKSPDEEPAEMEL